MIRKILIVLAFAFFATGCLPRLGNGGGATSQSEFAKAKPVSGFPNMPRYPKAQLLESIDDKDSFGASFIVDEELQKVVDFYFGSLPQFGWEVTDIKKTDSRNVFEVRNAQYSGEVIINTAADSKSTAISVFVEPR